MSTFKARREAALRASVKEGDLKLRRLWAQYLSECAEYEAAAEKYLPLRRRYDADYSRAARSKSKTRPVADANLHKRLWRKHRLERPAMAIHVVCSKLRRTLKAIRRTRAEGLFGIGVKMAAVEEPLQFGGKHREPYDFLRAHEAAVRDLIGLTGNRFGGILKKLSSTDIAF